MNGNYVSSGVHGQVMNLLGSPLQGAYGGRKPIIPQETYYAPMTNTQRDFNLALKPSFIRILNSNILS